MSPKLYISISIFSSNEDSSYFQAQLHALSLFLGSLLPQVENNCILVYQYIDWYIMLCAGLLVQNAVNEINRSRIFRFFDM